MDWGSPGRFRNPENLFNVHPQFGLSVSPTAFYSVHRSNSVSNGAVFDQVQDGMKKAICYASKALSKSQTRYSATRRERFAIVTFTRHFRHYLLWRKFTIVTDHRELQWLRNFKITDGMTARWLERLASFDYTVRPRPRTSIGQTDGLSRVPSHEVNVVAQNSGGNECPHQDESNQWEHSTMTQRNNDDHESTSSEEWPKRKIQRNSHFHQTFRVHHFVTKRSLATCSIQLTPSPIVSPPISKCQPA